MNMPKMPTKSATCCVFGALCLVLHFPVTWPFFCNVLQRPAFTYGIMACTAWWHCLPDFNTWCITLQFAIWLCLALHCGGLILHYGIMACIALLGLCWTVWPLLPVVYSVIHSSALWPLHCIAPCWPVWPLSCNMFHSIAFCALWQRGSLHCTVIYRDVCALCL